MRENLRIALQKISDEQIIKAPTEFEGIEKYVYILGEDKENVQKLTFKDLDTLGLTKEEAIEIAEENSNKVSCFEPIGNVIAGMLIQGGARLTPEDLRDILGTPMFLIRNIEDCKGASALLNRAMIKHIANRFECESFIAIPSSVDEVLLVPQVDGFEMDLDSVTEMVKAVNPTLKPDMVLSDRAYKIAA